MNKKLLQQLALAKQAGTQSMAKDFFAKTPSPGTDPTADPAAGGGAMPPGGDVQTSAAPGGEPSEPGEKGLEMEANGQDMTPEQLEELLQLLQSQGGGQG